MLLFRLIFFFFALLLEYLAHVIIYHTKKMDILITNTDNSS